MKKLFHYILILLVIIIFQAIVYFGFLRPAILTWGASDSEVTETLPGDEMAPCISSTRAITINAPASIVWKWLVQLGADRGGFYSYTFIEHLSGYDTDNSIVIVPEYQSMEVGRIVPSTRSDSGAKENWRVVEVDPGKSFVLENWGAFVLRPVDSRQTRLIVRTRGWDTPTPASKAGQYILEPLHYLMERRMLMGIRDRAEAGPEVPLPQWPDLVWFFSIVLSGLVIAANIFTCRGFYKILRPAVLGALWLVTLFILNPRPVYGIILFAITVTTTWLFYHPKNKSI
jgi:hypothetical protein